MSKSQNNKLSAASYNNTMQPTYCPGCGNFGIVMALKQAFTELQLPPHKIFMVWGIGCSSNTANWFNVYGVHSLHGRAVPVASAAKLVNPNLTVVAQGGDGDGYGIGLGHYIHAMRRNLDITYIVHNNQIYGLTTGQASPTSDHGMKTKSTPCGVIERPINPIALALSSEATFIARGFAGDVNHLKELIIAGIKHRGFSLIDVLQPCITWNKDNTYEWLRERVYKLENSLDKQEVFKKSQEWKKKIPIGLFYQEKRLTYRDEMTHLKPDESVVSHDIAQIDISGTLEEFV